MLFYELVQQLNFFYHTKQIITEKQNGIKEFSGTLHGQSDEGFHWMIRNLSLQKYVCETPLSKWINGLFN